MKKTPRILLVWHRIGDYHRARWKALSDVVGCDAVFAADLGNEDNLYRWQSTTNKTDKYYLLSNKSVNRFDLFRRVYNFIKVLIVNRIRVVAISGYGNIDFIFFIIISRLLGRKVLLFAESWYKSNRFATIFKIIFLRIFCNGFLVSGRRAFSHFSEAIKIPEKKIRTAYSVVDNQHFIPKSIRRLNKKNEKPILLCIARFSEEKNLLFLIQAFKKSKISQKYILHLVGDGNLYPEILKQTENQSNITIQLWASYNVLPVLYQQANIFILPSTFEPWGLVVNEAMAAGLPIIASTQCGCVPDLIDSTNGFLFDAFNENELVSLLNYVSDIELDTLYEMGKNSQKIIANFTTGIWAKNLLELI